MASEVVELVDVGQETTGDCPECDGSAVRDGRETVCEDCGLVLDEDQIDHGPEWTNFEDRDGEQSRVGPPRSAAIHDGGVGAEMGKYRDANGSMLDARKRKRLGRMRMYHARARFESKRDRNRGHAFGEIHRMTCALGIGSKRREQACRLFKQAQDADLVHGHSLEAMAAGAIYAVARLNGDHVDRDAIAAVARVCKSRIDCGYDVYNRDLGLPTPPPEPGQYLGHVCNELGVGDECRRAAAAILDSTGDLVCGGQDPRGLAAACVYLAAQRTDGADDCTQIDVGEAARVSDVTVRKRRDDVLEVLDDAE